MSDKKTTKLDPIVEQKAPLLEAIKAANLAKVFVGLGAGVDPDGLACQMAMKAIIKEINPEAKVLSYYRGDWDRAQNRTMREVLGLNPKSYKEADICLTEVDGKSVTAANYTCAIMVDGNASVMPPNMGVDFVIDHHDPSPKKAKVGEDIRLIGSCSAIMWEYIMECNPTLLEGEKGAKLATALAIGIATDTENMTVPKTSALDWEAYAYCGTKSDPKLYSAIMNYQRPAYEKDMEMAAWNAKDEEGSVLTTQCGVIPRERKGIISSCAQDFCGRGPIKTTLVGALIDGDVHFSFRTMSASINANDFIQSKLTKHGGGKPGAGAGVIRLPDVFQNLPEDIQLELFLSMWKAISHKTFEYAGDGVRQAKGE